LRYAPVVLWSLESGQELAELSDRIVSRCAGYFRR